MYIHTITSSSTTAEVNPELDLVDLSVVTNNFGSDTEAIWDSLIKVFLKSGGWVYGRSFTSHIISKLWSTLVAISFHF